MSYEIYESSNEAKAKIKSYDDKIGVSTDTHHLAKYPLNGLKIGQCFTVTFATANEASLRMSALNCAKKTGKKFCVLKHKNFACFEIARIA